MNKKPLKILLKEKLSGQQLNDREYTRLEKCMKSRQGKTAWIRNHWLASSLALAASVLFVIVVLIYPSDETVSPGVSIQVSEVVPDMMGSSTANPSAIRIAEEVLTNHILIKQMDIETGSIEEVRNRFDKLDFAVLTSQRMPHDSLTLLGARYCTLQGFIATQLLFQTHAGEKVTHYQAAYDQTRFGPLPDISLQQPPIILAERGYTVEIWREAGLVMARAQAAL
jgi:hypothetical protein